LSGRVWEIRIATDDAENMKAMVDLQWACIQIDTMSGAAGSPDFLTDRPWDYNDDGLSAWHAEGSRSRYKSREVSSGEPSVRSPNAPAENNPPHPPTDPESHETSEKRPKMSPE